MYKLPKTVVIGLLLGVIPTPTVKAQAMDFSYEEFYNYFLKPEVEKQGVTIPAELE